jgi:hypothetical protein
MGWTDPKSSGNVTTQDTSGWNPISAALSYASPTTMNINTDMTGVVPKYVKLRWKQGTSFKYAYLVNITAALWTINTNLDYSVANAPITDVAWSISDPAIGFPKSFNYTPSFTNFVLGNGVLFAKAFIANGYAEEIIQITFGTTTAITALAPRFGTAFPGNAYVFVSGVSSAENGSTIVTGITEVNAGGTLNTISPLVSGSGYGAYSATAPFTWGPGCKIFLTAKHELA